MTFLPARCIKRDTCCGNVGGWLAGCPSHAGIVSEWLNLSEIFFDRLKANGDRYPISRGTPSAGALNTRGREIGDFRPTSPFISEMVRDMPMITMER